MAFGMEFLGSLLADYTSKASAALFTKLFTSAGDLAQEQLKERLNPEFANTFALLISQMEDPYRSALNRHHEQAVRAYVQNKMERLMVEAVKNVPKQEKIEYFTYVSLLLWDQSRQDPDDPSVWYPSVQQEMAKLESNAIPEFFRREGERVRAASRVFLGSVQAGTAVFAERMTQWSLAVEQRQQTRHIRMQEIKDRLDREITEADFFENSARWRIWPWNWAWGRVFRSSAWPWNWPWRRLASRARSWGWPW